MKHDAMIGAKEFALSDLLQKENLVLLQAVKDFTTIFDIMLPRDSDGAIRRPLLIGIDGAVAAGKSFLAAVLQSYLEAQEIKCVVIHGDSYAPPKAWRTKAVEWARHNPWSMGAYDQMACDYRKIADAQTRIDEFLQTGAEHYCLSVPQSGDLNVTRQSVIVFEGMGILNAELSPLFDVAIRVDMDSPREAFARLVARENHEYNRLPEGLLRERYDLVDSPYTQYLRSRDGEFFDFLVDTTDTSAIKVYRRNQVPIGRDWGARMAA